MRILTTTTRPMDTTRERTMHGHTLTAFGSLFLIALLATPGGLEAQRSDPAPPLPEICEPGSRASEAMREWCDRRLDEGAVLLSQRTAQAAPVAVAPLGGDPGAAAPRADAGPVVPEAVLEEIPTLPRRSTDPDAARRVRARIATAMELPLERIRARTTALDGRVTAFRTLQSRRSSSLVRSPDELLRQMTGDGPPDLFQLIEARRRGHPRR